MNHYPQSVEAELDMIVQAAQPAMEEHSIQEEHIREVFGEFLFDNWLNGGSEEGVPPFDDDQFFHLLKLAQAHSIFADMVKGGVVDVIDDGDGNEFVFLTELGKSIQYNMEESWKK